jgi:ppGpp synthetase/RelA/SpoT-type nucleotidyltranferase
MGKMADAWLSKYRQNFALYQEAAKLAKQQIDDALLGAPLSIQIVSTRAKNPDSVAEKIVRQGYGRPSQQMDDLIGVRIITLYDHTVDEVARRLRARFDVVEERSSDKSKQLALRQVGYRSNHLVMRVRKAGLASVSAILTSTLVEVQIRSVIAHAWAEIEHSLRYKVGEGVPDHLFRRFDALAGTLELVDREFSSIEEAIVEHVGSLSTRYASQQGLDEELSSVQLLGCIAAFRAETARLGPRSLVLEIEEAFRLAKILKRAGVRTVGDLARELQLPEVHRVIRGYAELDPSNIAPEQASARVVLGAVIGLRSPDLLEISGTLDSRLIQALAEN